MNTHTSIVLLRVFIIIFFIVPVFTFATDARLVTSPYLYNFNSPDSRLIEAMNDTTSTSPYWWLNSGGYMNIKDGKGSTVIGNLDQADKWRLLYSQNNPEDTDNGFHPQNIFRLLTRSKWQNAREEAYFSIKTSNLSKSQNRNQSNGILLFSRYQNSNNLYYAGVRVDGSAIIKKKVDGKYFTLAEIKSYFPGKYDHTTNPNLLPKDKWIGLRLETINTANQSVEIRLYTDVGWTGKWTLAAKATDNNSSFGRSLLDAGSGGIRTDFMDVEFDNFRFSNL